MELITSNNIYIDIGDNQYQLIKNEYIYDYKNYYFKNEIKIRYCNHIFIVNLNNEKYFQIKSTSIGNYIFLFVFSKSTLFYNKVIKINKSLDYYIKNYNFQYDKNVFYKYKLEQLILILRNKLGKEMKFPEDVIFNIKNKLNIIEKDINILQTQKILYYIQYISSNFHI